MCWFSPAFAIALDRASKPAGYDGLREVAAGVEVWYAVLHVPAPSSHQGWICEP